MGIMQSLRRKDRRAPSAGDLAERQVMPVVTQGPPLVLLVPDAQGIAAYHMHTFTIVRAAQHYVDVTLRGQVPDRTVAFWALTSAPQPGYNAEPLVIVRDADRPVVYLFSFADLDSCYDFIRHEMNRGLELAHVILYWAAPAAIEMDFWGRAAVSPQAAPPVLGTEAAAIVPDYAIATTENDGEAAAVIPFVPRVETTSDRPRYLKRSDIADTVREMQDFTTRFDAERAEVIDFPVASDSVRRHKQRSQAKAVWSNFAHALDEALDVYVAEQVRLRLAINRIVRALAQAASIQKGRSHEATDPDGRDEASGWFYASVALADAATIQVRRSLMRKVWMNTAWTLEEAAYAHRLETNARTRRAWHALSHACAAAGVARAGQGAAWARLACAFEQAVDAHKEQERTESLSPGGGDPKAEDTDIRERPTVPDEDDSETEEISRWLEKQVSDSPSGKPRWEPREEPFEGFRSPPGRF
jgi:hypothetical protein